MMRTFAGFAVLLAAVGLAARPADAALLTGRVVDADSGDMLPARVYVRTADGAWHFPASSGGSSVVYDKVNWLRNDAVEHHVTLSGDPWTVELSSGRCTITAERGKEYHPAAITVDIADDPVSVTIPLLRWIGMDERGWYSGDMHLHRSLEELPNVLLAEDLNVAMPLTFWVKDAAVPPAESDGRNVPGELIAVDATHVIWPRNTEYEIFSIGDRRHTLGALFVLGHRDVLDFGVPPWGGGARRAAADGALLDMDKLDWPASMALPPSTGATLYEVANNHLWRTEFAFRDWNSEAPPFLQPPAGGSGGGEWDWLRCTLGMWDALLNAGFPLVPSAGTASGVHPVPAGFSRVYVHLPDGFSYDEWIRGLKAGRSFVTTGPMLMAAANGEPCGSTIALDDHGEAAFSGEVVSARPVGFMELIADGACVRTIRVENRRTEEGAFASRFSFAADLAGRKWVTLRCFEDRTDGRPRFAQTGPWHLAGPEGEPALMSWERAYFVDRVRREIERSASLVSREALAEYEDALEHFASLPVSPDPLEEARAPESEEAVRKWLANMIGSHAFEDYEVRLATGLPLEEVAAARDRFELERRMASSPSAKDAPIFMLPYPGGRHPRIGFKDGAIRPQRETKLSLFAPWPEGGYAVIDLPEAIFSNLGLTYLAHTHIPTIWDESGQSLERLEWKVSDSGGFMCERTLPNGISFSARADPCVGGADFELSITNGTSDTLTDLRAQVCVMLKGLPEMNGQTGAHKRVEGSAAAVSDPSGERWLVTAWSPSHRAWQNPPVPCLHSDPTFPDCEPGQTVRARGVIRFCSGAEIDDVIRSAAAEAQQHQ